MSLKQLKFQEMSGAIICAGSCLAIYAGLMLQLRGYFPCSLCVLARYAFIGTAILSFMLLVKDTRWQRVMLRFVIVLGLCVAIVHEFFIATQPTLPTINSLEPLLNRIPAAEWFPMLLKSEGDCLRMHRSILGMQIPTISLGLFGLFSLLSFGSAFLKK